MKSHNISESSENPFVKIMVRKSSDDLQDIITDKHKYEFEAYIAAVEELERRHLATPELLQEKAEMIGSEKLKRQEQEVAEEERRFSMRHPFQFGPNYIFTPFIIGANVLVFIIMVVSGVDVFQPSVANLIDWGGNLSSLTLNGELWRLSTNTFLHGGVIHLLFNMYALLQVGFLLEESVGKYRYLVTYIASGVLASIASIIFNDNIVSVGASGAIFGVDGLLLSMLITKRLNIPQEYRKNFLTATLIFIGYNLVYGFAKEGIDNAAHIGGLISGFIIGFIYYPSLKHSKSSILVSSLIMGFVLIVALLSPQFITNKFGEFQTAMEKFIANEKKALWMYKEDVQSEVNTRYNHRLKVEGIDLWKENLSLLNSLTDMPDHLQTRIELLKKYCALRIQSCEAMQQSAQDFDAGREKVKQLESSIRAVVDELESLNK